MKQFILFILILISLPVFSQQPVNLYNPTADAAADIQKAVQQANEQHKHVLVQVGGNWCSWCVRLHGVFESESRIDSILKADYVFVLVNYSKENKNEKVLASYGYPQRFGFPVLMVLDENGQRIHTQNTAYLEKDKGYDVEKISEFLLSWNTKALDPKTYVK
jgi:thioredoxin-related protein